MLTRIAKDLLLPGCPTKAHRIPDHADLAACRLRAHPSLTTVGGGVELVLRVDSFIHPAGQLYYTIRGFPVHRNFPGKILSILTFWTGHRHTFSRAR